MMRQPDDPGVQGHFRDASWAPLFLLVIGATMLVLGSLFFVFAAAPCHAGESSVPKMPPATEANVTVVPQTISPKPAPLVAIIVTWCLALAPIASFDPHQLDAVGAFARANPDTCFVEPPQRLEPGVTLDACRRGHMMNYMPGFLAQHPGALYLGARCEARPAEPLDIEVMKRRVGR